MHSGKHMYLFLRKRPEHMFEDVLEPAPAAPAPEGGSLWAKARGVLSRGGAAAPAAPATTGMPPTGVDSGPQNGSAADLETINVFTIASGHMYERLQKIMILSVIKRTANPVKFWFIKNYMSPQMKAAVPLMARQYGFQYE